MFWTKKKTPAPDAAAAAPEQAASAAIEQAPSAPAVYLGSYDFQAGLGEPLFRLSASYQYLIYLVYALLVGVVAYSGLSYATNQKTQKQIAQLSATTNALQDRTTDQTSQLKSLESGFRSKDYWLPLVSPASSVSFVLSKLLDALPSNIRLTDVKYDQSRDKVQAFTVTLSCQIIARDRTEAENALNNFRHSFTDVSKFEIVDNKTTQKSQQAATYRGSDARLYQVEELWHVEAPVRTPEQMMAAYHELDRINPVLARSRITSGTPAPTGGQQP